MLAETAAHAIQDAMDVAALETRFWSRRFNIY
jgi:hypothetical protein